MTITVAELINPKSEDTLLTEQLALLAAADPPLPVTAWQPGDVALTLLETEAGALADVHQTVGLLGAAAFLGTATGGWLTLRAKSTFDLDRILATYTTGTGTLTNAASAGPYSITPGGLVVATPGGLRYRSTNLGNVTVPAGGSVSIGMRAEGSGTAYNRAGGDLSVLVTPANAGMSFAAASGSLWITATARDEETDAALVARCRARWATLAVAGCGTRDAYTFNILGAQRPNGDSAGVTRVGFLPAPGNGEVPIRIAGATGLISDADRDYVRAWIAVRKPITDTPLIEHAGEVAIDLSTSSVTFRAGFNTSANWEAVRTAVRDFVNAQPMGSDTELVLIDEAAIAAAIYGAVSRGSIADVDLTCGDTTVTTGSVATVDTSTLTFA